jgi:hypothetical protein
MPPEYKAKILTYVTYSVHVEAKQEALSVLKVSHNGVITLRITGFLDFCPLSSILKTTEHDVLETGSVSVLR